MKKLIFIICLFCFACNNDCPECGNMPNPFKLFIENESGENLLNPATENALEIESIKFNNGQIMTYTITTDYMIESIDPQYFENCTDKDGEFYIFYKNSPLTDTMNVFFETIITEPEKNCTCTGYQTKYMKYNGVVITNYVYDAAIVTK